jgi:hypothetical protein
VQPKEATPDQPPTKELELRGRRRQLMEDRASPEGPVCSQEIAGGGVVLHGSVRSVQTGGALPPFPLP